MQSKHSGNAASAIIKGGIHFPDLKGVVRFFQRQDKVLVVAQITGLPSSNESGFFAMHIHEGTSCGDDFQLSGSHFDPTGTPHPRHAGDLPPLLSCNGSAYLSVMTDRFKVRDIIGRTVIIHSGPDDFHTQPAGNSGNKIACGVIRRK